MRWTSLFSRRTPKAARKANKPNILRPKLEALEDRLTPVVNAAASFPATIGPAAGFDGVVQITSPTPDPTRTALGTGTLLSSGRHILTAAHIVDNNGDRTVEPGTHTVRFDLNGRAITLNVPASDITLHNQWNGTFNQGSDIAIMKLPEIAPFTAEGRSIYRDTQEVDQGKYFTFLGYGGTNRTDASGNVLNGNNGHSGNAPVQNPGVGPKLQGFNRIDQISTGKDSSDDYLVFDLDNPASKTDPGVAGEALSAQGDSGGPLLITNLIAGVSSGSTDKITNFGDNSLYTRVSSFADWIDDELDRRYHLVLDLNNQLEGNNGIADTLTVVTGNIPIVGERLFLSVNGKAVFADFLSAVRSITIRGSNDVETINLEPSNTPIRVPIIIDGGGGVDTVRFAPVRGDLDFFRSSVTLDGGTILGTDRLIINDSLNTGGNRTSRVTGNTVRFPSGATVTYTRFGEITVLASPAKDATVNVQGTAAGALTTIFSAANVNVGGPSSNRFVAGTFTENIRGKLSIMNPFVDTALTIDDSGSSGTPTVDVLSDEIRGLTQNPIDVQLARLSSLTIRAGSGGNVFNVDTIRANQFLGSVALYTGTGKDTVNVQRMLAPVTVNGQLGRDTVNVGLNGNMDGIGNTLTINNAGEYSDVILDDRNDPTGDLGGLQFLGTYTRVDGLATGMIDLRSRDLSSLSIWGGPGHNTFEVFTSPESAFPGMQTTLHSGDGNDVVNVYRTFGPLNIDGQQGLNQVRVGSPTAGLDRINGVVSVSGAGGTNILTVDDAPTKKSHDYVLDKGVVQRTDKAAIFFTDLVNLNLRTGTARDPIAVRDTSAGLTTVLTNGGNDPIAVTRTTDELVLVADGSSVLEIGSNTSSLDAIQGRVVIYTNPVNSMTLLLNDSAATTFQTLNAGIGFGQSYVRSGAAEIATAVGVVANVRYQGGSGGTYGFVNATAIGTTTTIVGSAGVQDLFAVGFAADVNGIRGAVTFLGNAADADFAYYYDFLNPAKQNYTVDTNPFAGTMLIQRPGVAPVQFGGIAVGVSLLAPFVGGSTLDVRSTPAGSALGIAAGKGDIITLGSNGSKLGGTVDGIEGHVFLGSGDSKVIVDDSGNTKIARDVSHSTYDIVGTTYGQIDGLTKGGISFVDRPLLNVDVRLGTLDDSFLMSGPPPATRMKIDGGKGNDILVGSGGVILQGGAGSDLLIAGAKASILYGDDPLTSVGAGEDILIGGTTIHDTNLAKLKEIRDVWTLPTEDYATRVGTLRNGLLGAGTVTGNGGGNSLYGMGGMDFFFLSVALDDNDLNNDGVNDDEQFDPL